MMSAVIHNGILKPTKILQEAVGCVADGNIGSKTLLAVHKADKKVLLKSLHEGLKNKYSSSKSVYKQAFLNSIGVSILIEIIEKLQEVDGKIGFRWKRSNMCSREILIDRGLVS